MPDIKCAVAITMQDEHIPSNGRNLCIESDITIVAPSTLDEIMTLDNILLANDRIAKIAKTATDEIINELLENSNGFIEAKNKYLNCIDSEEL